MGIRGSRRVCCLMSLLQPSNALADLEPLANQLRLIASEKSDGKSMRVQGMLLYKYNMIP